MAAAVVNGDDVMEMGRVSSFKVMMMMLTLLVMMMMVGLRAMIGI